MGHIGTYGDPVYISELENDIGLTTDSGTVTDVHISAGKFEGVQNPTTVPLFKIPTHTSHLENSEGWKDGTIRTVKRNDNIVATHTPPESGLADIEVYTHLSQFTNDAGYTNNAGTITGLNLYGGVPTEGKTITIGPANLNASGNINDYFNNGDGVNGEYAERAKVKQITNIEYVYDIDGFDYTDTDIPTPSIYLLRYGKLRLLYFSIVFSASNTKIKTNSEYILGTFKTTGKDKPSSRYNSRRFSIGDGETVYNSNVNHYYPVSVILGSTSSLMLEIGGEGSSHDACTTTNFSAIWLSDYEYN